MLGGKRICKKCGVEFMATGNNTKYCPNCRAQAHKQKKLEHRIKNHDKYIQYEKERYQKNKEQRNKQAQEWYQRNKEAKKAQTREYRQKNLTAVRAYDRKRAKTEHRKQWKSNKVKNDICFRMSNWCRNQIYRCISATDKNNEHTLDILGYTPQQLKARIEFQMKPDMTWDNYGIVWNIDHRKPLALFEFVDKDGNVDKHKLRIANSLANLKPLYVTENYSKNKKIEEN